MDKKQVKILETRFEEIKKLSKLRKLKPEEDKELKRLAGILIKYHLKE